ncbi:MAG: hypothetical protein ACRED5_16740, partial [Propylenella sp.]
MANAKPKAHGGQAAEAAPLPSGAAVEDWARSEPESTGDFDRDSTRYSAFWQRAAALISALPPKKRRSDTEAGVAARILATARASRERFLAAHAAAVYDSLTQNRSRFMRLEELVFAAAVLVPGLTPTRDQVAAQDGLLLSEREGHEVDQGIFLAHVLADERRGTHLCHSMLLQRPEAAELASRFAKDGVLDLGVARLERRGKAVHLLASNPRFLNAEDWTTLALTETAVDVAILDKASAI